MKLFLSYLCIFLEIARCTSCAYAGGVQLCVKERDVFSETHTSFVASKTPIGVGLYEKINPYRISPKPSLFEEKSVHKLYEALGKKEVAEIARPAPDTFSFKGTGDFEFDLDSLRAYKNLKFDVQGRIFLHGDGSDFKNLGAIVSQAPLYLLNANLKNAGVIVAPALWADSFSENRGIMGVGGKSVFLEKKGDHFIGPYGQKMTSMTPDTSLFLGVKRKAKNLGGIFSEGHGLLQGHTMKTKTHSSNATDPYGGPFEPGKHGLIPRASFENFGEMNFGQSEVQLKNFRNIHFHKETEDFQAVQHVHPGRLVTKNLLVDSITGPLMKSPLKPDRFGKVQIDGEVIFTDQDQSTALFVAGDVEVNTEFTVPNLYSFLPENRRNKRGIFKNTAPVKTLCSLVQGLQNEGDFYTQKDFGYFKLPPRFRKIYKQYGYGSQKPLLGSVLSNKGEGGFYVGRKLKLDPRTFPIQNDASFHYGEKVKISSKVPVKEGINGLTLTGKGTFSVGPEAEKPAVTFLNQAGPVLSQTPNHALIRLENLGEYPYQILTKGGLDLVVKNTSKESGSGDLAFGGEIFSGGYVGIHNTVEGHRTNLVFKKNVQGKTIQILSDGSLSIPPETQIQCQGGLYIGDPKRKGAVINDGTLRGCENVDIRSTDLSGKGLIAGERVFLDSQNLNLSQMKIEGHDVFLKASKNFEMPYFMRQKMGDLSFQGPTLTLLQNLHVNTLFMSGSNVSVKANVTSASEIRLSGTEQVALEKADLKSPIINAHGQKLRVSDTKLQAQQTALSAQEAEVSGSSIRGGSCHLRTNKTNLSDVNISLKGLSLDSHESDIQNTRMSAGTLFVNSRKGIFSGNTIRASNATMNLDHVSLEHNHFNGGHLTLNGGFLEARENNFNTTSLDFKMTSGSFAQNRVFGLDGRLDFQGAAVSGNSFDVQNSFFQGREGLIYDNQHRGGKGVFQIKKSNKGGLNIAQEIAAIEVLSGFDQLSFNFPDTHYTFKGRHHFTCPDLSLSFEGLENRGKISSNGNLGLFGKSSFKNHHGSRIWAVGDLVTATSGDHINWGTLSAEGKNQVFGKSIFAEVTVEQKEVERPRKWLFSKRKKKAIEEVRFRPVYKGREVQLNALGSIRLQGADLISDRGDISCETQSGDIIFAPDVHDQQLAHDRIQVYDGCRINSAKGLKVQARKGYFYGPVVDVKANAELGIFADLGISTPGYAQPYVADISSCRSGLFNHKKTTSVTQKVHYSNARFECQSAEFGTSEGGINLSGADVLAPKGHIDLSARSDIQVTALYGVIENHSKKAAAFGGRMTRRASMEVKSKPTRFQAKSVRVNSGEGQAFGDGPIFETPRLLFDVKNGIHFKTPDGRRVESTQRYGPLSNENLKMYSIMAASIFIPGPGQALFGSSGAAAMGTAAVNSVFWQMAGGMLMNQGNFQKTCHDFSMRSVATSALTAGLFANIDLPSDTFLQRFGSNMAEGFVSAAISAGIEGSDFQDNMKHAAVMACAKTGAQQIARARADPTSPVGRRTQELVHLALGAGATQVLYGDPIPGFVGAGAEIFGNGLMEGSEERVYRTTQDHFSGRSNVSLQEFQESYQKFYQDELRQNAKYAKFGALTAALLTGQDLRQSQAIANNAIENNFMTQENPFYPKNGFKEAQGQTETEKARKKYGFYGINEEADYLSWAQTHGYENEIEYSGKEYFVEGLYGFGRSFRNILYGTLDSLYNFLPYDPLNETSPLYNTAESSAVFFYDRVLAMADCNMPLTLYAGHTPLTHGGIYHCNHSAFAEQSHERLEEIYSTIGETLKSMKDAYVQASPPEKFGYQVEGLFSLGGAGFLKKRIVVGAENKLRYGVAFPPTFKHKKQYVSDKSSPLPNGREATTKGNNLFVINDKGELRIAPERGSETYRYWLSKDEKGKVFDPPKLIESNESKHFMLTGKSKEVFSAGEFHIDKNGDTIVSLGSGTFQPKGLQSKRITEKLFKKHGFKNVIFQDITLPGQTKPLSSAPVFPWNVLKPTYGDAALTAVGLYGGWKEAQMGDSFIENPHSGMMFHGAYSDYVNLHKKGSLHDYFTEIGLNFWKRDRRAPLVIFGHGNPDAVILENPLLVPYVSDYEKSIFKSRGSLNLSPGDLYSLLKNQGKLKPGRSSVLLSCFSGTQKYGFAQDFADYTGEDVQAFTKLSGLGTLGQFMCVEDEEAERRYGIYDSNEKCELKTFHPYSSSNKYQSH